MTTVQRKRLSGPTLFALIVASLPFLYALSIGPVYGICIPRHWVYTTTLDPIYQPLFRVAGMCRPPGSLGPSPASNWLREYVNWWMTNAKP